LISKAVVSEEGRKQEPKKTTGCIKRLLISKNNDPRGEKQEALLQ
jgi:hypothetical protein